ncbi:hypothetical protein ACE6ED_14700 [Paenibacillus sp. CN-4]|uniref:hypothetical protein n=1 Tax=Paenibacillus nanchangensis TaxID=3348343 RepID=UPI00397AAAEF
MQAVQPLEMEYYYNSEGAPINEVQSLGNCYTRNIFFVLRRYIKDSSVLCKMFLDDFNLKLITHVGNDHFELGLNEIKDPEDYIIVGNRHVISSNAEEAIRTIEKLLANNEVVFVNTLMKRVPFYRTFELNPALETDHIVDGHIFLVLGQTATDFYFLDNYINYNKEYFKPYPHNKNIGQDAKNSFRNAFNRQFTCFTVHPNYEELAELPARASLILRTSLENYYKPNSSTNGRLEYLGRSAIQELNHLFASGRFILNTKIANRPHDLYSLTRTTLTRHSDKKKVLLLLLNSLNNRNAFCDVIHCAEQSIEQWEVLRNAMTRQYIINEFKLTGQMEQHMANVLHAEDQFFHSLEKNMDNLCQI